MFSYHNIESTNNQKLMNYLTRRNPNFSTLAPTNSANNQKLMIEYETYQESVFLCNLLYLFALKESPNKQF